MPYYIDLIHTFAAFRRSEIHAPGADGMGLPDDEPRDVDTQGTLENCVEECRTTITMTPFCDEDLGSSTQTYPSAAP